MVKSRNRMPIRFCWFRLLARRKIAGCESRPLGKRIPGLMKRCFACKLRCDSCFGSTVEAIRTFAIAIAIRDKTRTQSGNMSRPMAMPAESPGWRRSAGKGAGSWMLLQNIDPTHLPLIAVGCALLCAVVVVIGFLLQAVSSIFDVIAGLVEVSDGNCAGRSSRLVRLYAAPPRLACLRRIHLSVLERARKLHHVILPDSVNGSVFCPDKLGISISPIQQFTLCC